MRTFIAAYPPAEVIDHLRAFTSRLSLARPTSGPGTSLRAVPPEQWHVTLAFLGDIPDPDVALAREALDAATGAPGVVRLRVAGGGRFGSGRFTVVWAGLDGDVRVLCTVADRIRAELTRVGLPFDNRPLQPHLTLGRPGDRLPLDAVTADLTALDSYVGPDWTVDSLHLMRSRPGPHRQYDLVHRTALDAD